MKNPLDPRQYTPYALNVPSGNLHTEEGVDFFNLILLESLTGDFNITGSLILNGEFVYSPNTTNAITADGRSHMFNGINNTVTGTDNTIVSASNSTVAGQNNTLIGGINNDISGDYSNAFGSYINILHTGAMVLKDGQFTVGEDLGDNTFAAYFIGGIFLQNKTHVDDELWVTGGDFFTSGYNITTTNNVNVGGSGMLSGDLQVLGIPYHTGSKLQNLQDFRDNSGIMSDAMHLASGILRTGLIHLNWASVLKTGDMYVSGRISHNNDFFLKSGQWLYGGTGAFDASDNRFTTLKHDTGVGGSGAWLESHNGIKFIVDKQDSGAQIQHSGDHYFSRNGFSVWDGASTSNLLFGVSPSGDGYFAGPIQIEQGVGVPATASAAGGRVGTIAVDDSYIYVCTAENTWKRAALVTW